ncbi:MAG: hypothetical protein LUG65_00290 [Clostridiales bacterium]|nr:hypothetical protein [Clostridiales bacterium]
MSKCRQEQSWLCVWFVSRAEEYDAEADSALWSTAKKQKRGGATMADKELRGMNRTELIEIIYALQQNERTLRAENEALRRQLDDKILRMEKAGSIAEAALSLNHIFEDAEAAAQQYLDSLRAMTTMEEPPAEKTEEPLSAIHFVQVEAEDSDQTRQEEQEAEVPDQENVSQEEPDNSLLSTGGEKIKAIYQRFSARKEK